MPILKPEEERSLIGRSRQMVAGPGSDTGESLGEPKRFLLQQSNATPMLNSKPSRIDPLPPPNRIEGQNLGSAPTIDLLETTDGVVVV